MITQMVFALLFMHRIIHSVMSLPLRVLGAYSLKKDIFIFDFILRIFRTSSPFGPTITNHENDSGKY